MPGKSGGLNGHRLRVVKFEVMFLSVRIMGGKNALTRIASKIRAGTQARIAPSTREYPRKPIKYNPAAEMRRMAQVRATV